MPRPNDIIHRSTGNHADKQGLSCTTVQCSRRDISHETRGCEFIRLYYCYRLLVFVFKERVFLIENKENREKTCLKYTKYRRNIANLIQEKVTRRENCSVQNYIFHITRKLRFTRTFARES